MSNVYKIETYISNVGVVELFIKWTSMTYTVYLPNTDVKKIAKIYNFSIDSYIKLYSERMNMHSQPPHHCDQWYMCVSVLEHLIGPHTVCVKLFDAALICMSRAGKQKMTSGKLIVPKNTVKQTAVAEYKKSAEFGEIVLAMHATVAAETKLAIQTMRQRVQDQTEKRFQRIEQKASEYKLDLLDDIDGRLKRKYLNLADRVEERMMSRKTRRNNK